MEIYDYEELFGDDCSEESASEDEDISLIDKLLGGSAVKQIETDLDLENVGRKLAWAEKKRDIEVKRLESQMAWYKAEIEKTKERFSRIHDHYEYQIASYFATKEHKVTKTGQEKYKTPHVEITLKPQEPEYKIDSEAFISYLGSSEATQEYLTPQPPKPDWARFKKLCTVVEVPTTDPISGEQTVTFALSNKDTGEIINGVTVTPRDKKLVISVKEDA